MGYTSDMVTIRITGVRRGQDIIQLQAGFELIISKRGARGVMVIIVRNGYGDTSSNPGRD